MRDTHFGILQFKFKHFDVFLQNLLDFETFVISRHKEKITNNLNMTEINLFTLL